MHKSFMLKIATSQASYIRLKNMETFLLHKKIKDMQIRASYHFSPTIYKFNTNASMLALKIGVYHIATEHINWP
jgi:hypothetical protein